MLLADIPTRCGSSDPDCSLHFTRTHTIRSSATSPTNRPNRGLRRDRPPRSSRADGTGIDRRAGAKAIGWVKEGARVLAPVTPLGSGAAARTLAPKSSSRSPRCSRAALGRHELAIVSVRDQKSPFSIVATPLRCAPFRTSRLSKAMRVLDQSVPGEWGGPTALRAITDLAVARTTGRTPLCLLVGAGVDRSLSPDPPKRGLAEPAQMTNQVPI